MSFETTYPVTPRLPYRVFCIASANQTAPTDHSLAITTVLSATAAAPGKLLLPEEANNLELRFFAYDSGSTDPENDSSTFKIYGYSAEGLVPGVEPLGQTLCDVAVVYGAKLLTKNPYTGATEAWAEGDAHTFTTYRGIVVAGNTVNDVGLALNLDVRGLKYVYVVCDDLAVSGTTVEGAMVLGRSY